MNILSFFIIVPLLMLAGLWASRSVNQVRGVMVTGASLLLALSVYLTIDYIGLRQAGAMEEMLFTVYPGMPPYIYVTPSEWTVSP